MEGLYLSREGVFPIAVEENRGAGALPTGLGVSGTIQGEGKLCGMPSLFVRLQGCNLQCRWTLSDGTHCVCDTAHTWPTRGGNFVGVDEILDVIGRHIGRMHHVVVTGGEPYLQREGLLALLEGLRSMNIHSTVETNSTLPYPDVASLTDLTSLSPKLSRSGLSPEMRELSVRSADVIVEAALEARRDVQLKFVVADVNDEKEILSDYEQVIEKVNPADVVVMPLGASLDVMDRTREAALSMAVKNGWRYGPRLHIDLFGNKEGT